MEEIINHGELLTKEESQRFFEEINQSITWLKIINLGEKTAFFSFYGSKDFTIPSLFSEQKALPWTGELLALKQLIEIYTNQRFNACVIIAQSKNKPFSMKLQSILENLEEESSIAFINLKNSVEISLNHHTSSIQNRQLIEHPITFNQNETIKIKGTNNHFTLIYFKIKS